MPFEHQHIEESKSTNQILWQRSEQERLNDFFCLSTGFQTRGKGQGENSWESEKDKNILMSFVVYPQNLNAADAFMISRWVSLSIVAYLTQKGVKSVSIKWPNDIYVGNSKICGILIQNAMMGSFISKSLVGIGLNLNQTKFESNAPNPVSLSLITHLQYHVLGEINVLMNQLQKSYREIWVSPEKLVSEYHRNLYQLNEMREYQIENQLVLASIHGVDEFGRLILLHQNQSTRSYDLKEIKFSLREV
jgi:BirA family biotin operon repressor/biotin-[acetyl-CoA-carboxylase] ligase